MSGRLLKRILNEHDKNQLQSTDPKLNDEDDEEHEEPESTDSFLPSSRNPFDLLNQEDDEMNESDPDFEILAGNIEEKELCVSKSHVPLVTTTNKKIKKKKEKNNDSLVSSSKTVQKVRDAFVKTSLYEPFDSVKTEAVKSCEILNLQNNSSILQVDPKYLNAKNELRRIFGSKVVKSVEKSKLVGSSRQRRGGHIARRTVIVTPSDHWPRWDDSLSMEFLEAKNGFRYFRYVHSHSYTEAQGAFDAAKANYDLNGITSVLRYHPYHIESLITMAEYFKFAGEQQMAADAIAKCLYALECAWHPMFTPLHGSCQIKYRHETNKPLFTALFLHMKNMDRHGCHRSALEVCKLLLSLDLDDPMGSLFCIDYYSLRAEEYCWLDQFSQEYTTDNSLWVFPNFSYSLAICRFYLERDADSKMNTGKSYSLDLMKQALLLHPPVLKKLVGKVPLKDQMWKGILKNVFFGSDKTESPSLDHLINIYVERSYLIWRLPDVQNLLMNAAASVVETLKYDETDAKNWACVRKEAFSTEKNEYSYLLASDFSDAVATMPPDNLQNFMVDPRMIDEQNANQIYNQGGVVRAPRDLANRSALAALFESILPWVDYGDEMAEADP